jgi:hypothetical protein
MELDNARGVFFVTSLGQAELARFAKLDENARARVVELFVVSSLPDPPAMSGTLAASGGRLEFTPRYPLVPGTKYRATLRNPLQLDAAARSFEFTIPAAAESEPARVTGIYPSADRLPENLLRFYIYFSRPMSRGEAYTHIRLVEANGKPVEAAFLELGEELWDKSLTRFTLLCDPGRVKRGLKPREELGSVLVDGKTYTLIVDEAWRDGAGHPLAASAKKTFRATAPVESPIDPGQWHLTAPAGDSREPVTLAFDRPLDRALVERLFSVIDGKGSAVTGQVELDEHELGWRFTPEQNWSAGDYQVVVPTVLEDCSGNRIGRAFEVDEFPTVQKSITTESISLPFRVK